MRWVESGDVRLAVFEDGDPAHPTVLLLHGYPDTHRVWDEVVARLRDRFHVVRYDVRGHGASTEPGDRRDYGFDRLMDDLRAVLDAVGKPKVHLVGHDWGALQGWEAVSRSEVADRVASFTSLGAPGLRHVAHFVRHGRRRDVAAQLARSWYIGGFHIPVVPELMWGSVLPRAIAGGYGDGVGPRKGHPAATLVKDARNGLWLYRRNMRAPWPGGRGAAGDGRGAADPRVRDVPVQLIEATRDTFVTPALLASIERWVDRFWHRRVVAGHWAQRSHPDLVAGMIAEFAAHVDGVAPSRELRRAGVRRGAFGGRLVVVAGAGSGIGQATARAFAAHGAEVVCADIDAEAAQRAVDGIAKELRGTAWAVPVDVGNIDQMEDFSRKIISQYGVPDIVVNNAGIVVAGPILDHTVDDWRRTIDVNLWGVIHGCRLFGAAMVERGQGGHIVNVASLAAFAPTRMLPAYSVSKAAVKSLSDCLRAELAGHGIGVSAICPGFVSTPLAHHATYVGRIGREEAVRGLARRGYPPERVAAHILRAVHRNQAVVPVNLEGKIGYVLSRISPGAMRGLARLG
jgi:NAD(P)-dependent dehydrogenase (short-subunit alcohol dehydrogenase family)/pimeloyl-ACP methyl ester carboxylesterase